MSPEAVSNLGLMVSKNLTRFEHFNHNTKLFKHKHVKKTELAYFCTEFQRLSVLLEYFDLFQRNRTEGVLQPPSPHLSASPGQASIHFICPKSHNIRTLDNFVKVCCYSGNMLLSLFHQISYASGTNIQCAYYGVLFHLATSLHQGKFIRYSFTLCAYQYSAIVSSNCVYISNTNTI